MRKTCSILILSYNGYNTIKKVISSIFRQKTNHIYEIIIIDSGSTDQSISLFKNLNIRLKEIKKTEFGHGATRNLGVSLSNSEIIVFLSQDAIPISDQWLNELLNPLDDEKVVGVYGKQVPYNTHICEQYFLEKTYSSQSTVNIIKNKEKIALPQIFFSNVNSACRREILLKVPFHEDVVMSEDQQWSKEVLEKNFKIAYSPKAAVYHSHNYSFKTIFKRNFDSGASLKQIIDGNLGKSSTEYIRDILDECRYAKEKESIKKIPFVLLYETFRLCGFVAGNYYYLLPKLLRKVLSQNPKFWDKSDNKT